MGFVGSGWNHTQDLTEAHRMRTDPGPCDAQAPRYSCMTGLTRGVVELPLITPADLPCGLSQEFHQVPVLTDTQAGTEKKVCPVPIAA